MPRQQARADDADVRGTALDCQLRFTVNTPLKPSK